MPHPAALRDHIGQEVGVSPWCPITQAQIDQFADITGDRQWIHVDPERARAESPYGSTIAHGFLTLSLLSGLFRRAVTIAGVRMGVNYGLDRVRFVAPVPADALVRGRFTPLGVTDAADGSLQVTWRATIERQHGEKPCCVAEWLVRYYPNVSEASTRTS